jgi:hypothetical protein
VTALRVQRDADNDHFDSFATGELDDPSRIFLARGVLQNVEWAGDRGPRIRDGQSEAHVTRIDGEDAAHSVGSTQTG